MGSSSAITTLLVTAVYYYPPMRCLCLFDDLNKLDGILNVTRVILRCVL